jgi:hypothetical protein
MISDQNRRSFFTATPSWVEISFVWLLPAVLFLTTVCQFLSFTRKVDDFGDNGAYLLAARGIHDWNFDNAPVKQFWGMSYVIALVSAFSIASVRLVVDLRRCSLASVLCAYQLWGPLDRRIFCGGQL